MPIWVDAQENKMIDPPERTVERDVTVKLKELETQ
jgi:hypothetical protein